MRFFTSDTHFGHANILHLGDGRPFKTIENMAMTIVENAWEVMSEDDELYHLGDVAMGPWPIGLQYIKLMPGTKFLVPGNHDRVSSLASKTRQANFRGDYEDVGFEILNEIEFTTIYDQLYVMSHYPYVGDSHDKDRFEKIRPTDSGLPLIHGHSHQLERYTYSPNGTLQISVGVDANDWTPVSEEQIYELTKEQR